MPWLLWGAPHPAALTLSLSVPGPGHTQISWIEPTASSREGEAGRTILTTQHDRLCLRWACAYLSSQGRLSPSGGGREGLVEERTPGLGFNRTCRVRDRRGSQAKGRACAKRM